MRFSSFLLLLHPINARIFISKTRFCSVRPAIQMGVAALDGKLGGISLSEDTGTASLVEHLKSAKLFSETKASIVSDIKAGSSLKYGRQLHM